MSYTEENNIPGLLMLIDFEKAFDSISWSFVYKVLHFFGFGENIINWIKIFNTNFKASILQSGFLSEEFQVQRGCRQGDPVSPYIFLLCAEILAILIKQNHDIKGIVINDKEHKISQYADDTSLALDGSAKSLHSALDTLERYANFSGLKINSSKTKLIWIGSKKFSAEVFHHSRWKLYWGATHFSLLGINFSVNLHEIVELNFKEQLPKIAALIQQWKRRILTPIGRITVAKTLIIPKLNHLFISLPNPSQETISNLTTQLFRFIWGSNCDKVKRKIVTQHHLQGGLNMLNLRNFILSLKCSWIQRAIKGNHSWLSILKNNYGQDVIDKMLNTGNDYVKKMLKCTSNVFWKDVLESRLFVNSKDLENVNLTQSEILLTPVWF